MDAPQAPDEPIRILLLEDDLGDAKLCERALRGSHPTYELSIAQTLEEARELAELHTFELVLSDLGLPGSDGIETLSTCKAIWPDLPIVLLSGRSDEHVAQETVRAGAQDYLVKGDINPRGLRRALHYAIERHRNAEERRRLVLELEQSRKLEAIGQLAAGVAHEINTPTQYVSDNVRFFKDAVGDLVPVLEEARRLASGDGGGSVATLRQRLEEADVEYLIEELPRALDQSLNGLGHIARIVRAMKEYSHPGSGALVGVDLNAALETVVTVASNEWRYVARIERDYDPELPEVACLPGEINQVFLNLIINAAHAVSEVVGDAGTGCITLRTRARGPYAEIAVEDSGPGVPPELADKIFEPFFTTKGVGKGTGQGLAIAHNVVVNKHGGSIHVEPAASGGATFIIRLPLEPAAGARKAA